MSDEVTVIISVGDSGGGAPAVRVTRSETHPQLHTDLESAWLSEIAMVQRLVKDAGDRAVEQMTRLLDEHRNQPRPPSRQRRG